MPRYIDADKIDYKVIVVGEGEFAGYRAVAYESDIDEMPTVDAVAVVRCKDCQWYSHKRACPLAASGLSADCIKLPKEDDFCSYGERRTK